MKRLKVNLNPKEYIGPEDVLGDTASPMYDGVSEKKLEVSPNKPHFALFFFFVFASFAFLAYYLIYFSVSRGDEYKQIAQNNAQSLYEFGASRGEIISSDGVVLASSESVFAIVLNPYRLDTQTIENISQNIATIGGYPADVLQNKIISAREQGLGRLVLLKNLSQDEVALYKDLVNSIGELNFEESSLRNYPQGSTFSHILGYAANVSPEELKKLSDYTLQDVVGKKGVEYYFEKYLRGTQGLFAKFLNARGEVEKEALVRQNEPGSTLELTVDARLQEAVYRALKNGLSEYNLNAGVAVVLDANTGAILSLVSLPDFDPNGFSAGLTEGQAQKYFSNPYKPLFNRATSGEYAVGSIIKPLIAAAALQEGIISPDKYLFTRGYIEVPSVYDPSVVYRFNDWKNHGAVDMREAIAVSSNVYFYTIGGGYEEQDGLGINKIAKYLNLFNWGKPLGINFAGESLGLIPTPEWKLQTKGERWAIGDTYNVSIGQGDILATPLQIAAATAVFANNGTLYKPYIVQKSYSQNGNVAEYGYDIINENFISPSAIRVVREGMRDAVLEGSSIFLSTLPQPVAGKTGTAQTGRGNNALFSGFGPYENSEIIVTVLLEEGETSNRAVRVAHEIFQAYFNQQNEGI